MPRIKQMTNKEETSDSLPNTGCTISAREDLSKREALIAACLTGILANSNMAKHPRDYAKAAIEQADAVLLVLNREKCSSTVVASEDMV